VRRCPERNYGDIIPHDLFGLPKFFKHFSQANHDGMLAERTVKHVETLTQDIVKSGLFMAKKAVSNAFYHFIVITG
jgi:hypothetical protein